MLIVVYISLVLTYGQAYVQWCKDSAQDDVGIYPPNLPRSLALGSPCPLADLINCTLRLPSSRCHLSYDDCLEDKTENYHNCSVLCMYGSCRPTQ